MYAIVFPVCCQTFHRVGNTIGINFLQHLRIWWRIDRRSPSCDFWSVVPRSWKKKPAMTNFAESTRSPFFITSSVLGLSTRYFIKVDLPDPAFPLIQYKPWP